MKIQLLLIRASYEKHDHDYPGSIVNNAVIIIYLVILAFTITYSVDIDFDLSKCSCKNLETTWRKMKTNYLYTPGCGEYGQKKVGGGEGAKISPTLM
jgi:hypothetical protein